MGNVVSLIYFGAGAVAVLAIRFVQRKVSPSVTEPQGMIHPVLATPEGNFCQPCVRWYMEATWTDNRAMTGIEVE